MFITRMFPHPHLPLCVPQPPPSPPCSYALHVFVMAASEGEAFVAPESPDDFDEVGWGLVGSSWSVGRPVGCPRKPSRASAGRPLRWAALPRLGGPLCLPSLSTASAWRLRLCRCRATLA